MDLERPFRARRTLNRSNTHTDSVYYPRIENDSDSYRLFQLLPGTLQEPIQCRLFTAKVSESTGEEYLAGSYVCGLASPARRILVNGVALYVGPNLYDFLSVMATRYIVHLPITLWIDAICIDQQSLQEQNHQVQLMGRIYRNAKRVIAYIGAGSKEIDWMFDRFNDRLWLADTRYWGIAGKIEALHSITRLLHALETFARLPYFTRLWIMQELVLSKKITFLGKSREVDWEFIINWIEDVNLYNHAPGAPKQTVDVALDIAKKALNIVVELRRSTLYMIHNFRRSRTQQSFYKLFCAFGELSCSIPHDKIYALSGMMADNTQAQEKFVVDYSLDKVSAICQVLLSYNIEDAIDFIRRALQFLSFDASSIPTPFTDADPEIALRLPWSGEAYNWHSVRWSTQRRTACIIQASAVARISAVSVCIDPDQHTLTPVTISTPTLTANPNECYTYLITRTPIHHYLLINHTSSNPSPRTRQIYALATPEQSFCDTCTNPVRTGTLQNLLHALNMHTSIEVQHTRHSRALILTTRLSLLIAMGIIFQSFTCSSTCEKQRLSEGMMTRQQRRYWKENMAEITEKTVTPILATAIG